MALLICLFPGMTCTFWLKAAFSSTAGEVRPSLPACSAQDLAEITRRAGNLWKRSYPEVKT